VFGDPLRGFLFYAFAFASALLFALTAWVPSLLLLRWLLF
jgi:hypothetical protein